LNDKLKLIVLVGPTAVGKTSLSLKIAMDQGWEIISADSRQLYKEMNIGTAKPTKEELSLVRHHFINYKSIHEYYSAGRFEVDVLKLLEQYDKKNFLMVGGSGLYVKAVCDGIDEMPGPNLDLRKAFQKRYEENGLKELTEELRNIDLNTWHSIDIQNPNRVIRALEVIHQTGKKYSEFKSKSKKTRHFDVLKIGLDMPREQLFARIDARVEAMIEHGLLDEVKSLIPWKGLTALQTVGYTEFFNYLEGKYDFREAVRLCKRNTRRYAKRQLTWFRKDKDIHWMSADNYYEVNSAITDFITK
jgi:tRNA dimethylallyltransferase